MIIFLTKRITRGLEMMLEKNKGNKYFTKYILPNILPNIYNLYFVFFQDHVLGSGNFFCYQIVIV